MENKRGLLLLSRSRQPNVQWCCFRNAEKKTLKARRRSRPRPAAPSVNDFRHESHTLKDEKKVNRITGKEKALNSP